ncbi:MAG TPA: sigma-70 family RNA polymerase sigma factor [Tepidisphaeraceae bacterium]|jgi:RNA polymerase sigma-70 factor (ECF subfamily)
MASSLSPRFVTTRWSIVVAAGGQGDGSHARRALEDLCRGYWYPLYAYVRRKGCQPDDAADLVQGFVTALLDRRAFAAADPTRGRFRAFLLASFDHFIANQRRHDNAHKRGGGKTFVGLDFADGERRYALEPAHDLTPDRIYQRRWALSLIDAAMARLRQDYADRGKALVFDALAPLISAPSDQPYAQLAQQLGMTEGAVKVAVHRLRKRCRDLLRDEVKETVADSTEVEDELAYLLRTL